MKSPIHFLENVEAASCRFPNAGKEEPANHTNDTNRGHLHSCDSLAKSSVHRLLQSLLLLAGTTVATGGDNPIPASLPGERYAEMSARSPFAVATAAPIPQTAQSFAANWYVSGMARLNGEDFVSIKSRDLSIQFSLHGREEDPRTGVALESVDWSDDVGRSMVILRKGTETARLEFNGADLRNPPQIAAASRPAPAPFAPAVFASALAQAKPPEIRRRRVPIPAPR
jgi:hypothetical protein